MSEVAKSVAEGVSEFREPPDVCRMKTRILSEEEKLTIGTVKAYGNTFIDLIDKNVPSGPDNTLAKRRIEEAVFWAEKAITA